MKGLYIAVLTITFLSCNNSNNSKAITNSDTTRTEKKDTFSVKELFVDKGEEEGWGADIKLSVVEKSENDTASIYKAVSSYNGQELGLLVFVPKRKEGDKGFGHGISLKSIGSQSNYLLQTLSQLYEQPFDKTAIFVKSIDVTYVNLKEFAKAVAGQEGQYTAANEYKLFFEGKSEEDYAELYLNINPTDNWLEIREKDEEYRPIVLRFLKQ